METAAPANRPQLPDAWLKVLESEFREGYMQSLRAFLVEERKRYRLYPPFRDTFNAFWLTPFDQVRVVILGQDPYHGSGQAHGLCFSVRRGVRPPPSLENIFLELHQELGLPRPQHGDLSAWAQQGVLLLNAVLSVRAGAAGSHRGQGWERFTDRVISVLAEQREGLVFVLWGSWAGQKARMIDRRKHLILTSPHPSPLSAHRGFFGCGHFARINQHLTERGEAPIDWTLPD
ncbi:MAG: uracil-DNA glycosylase [Myxococcales bacterium]|nr:uracil-DNA glycosylase [Myxococcales bacterium]